MTLPNWIKVALFLTLGFLSQTLSAQEFRMEVSSESILIGNQIKIRFVLENIEGTFEAPDFDEMPIVSGPNTSASIQIINGSKTSTKSYTYYIQPQNLGLYTIAPAYLITEAGTLETTPISINVNPNPDNIIEQPESDLNASFFQMKTFPFFDDLRTEEEIAPEEPTAKPKRKYKRI